MQKAKTVSTRHFHIQSGIEERSAMVAPPIRIYPAFEAEFIAKDINQIMCIIACIVTVDHVVRTHDRGYANFYGIGKRWQVNFV
ncbi:MAG TPA: hypothetical protein VIJ95_13050 [Hanamia sp.]